MHPHLISHNGNVRHLTQSNIIGHTQPESGQLLPNLDVISEHVLHNLLAWRIVQLRFYPDLDDKDCHQRAALTRPLVFEELIIKTNKNHKPESEEQEWNM